MQTQNYNLAQPVFDIRLAKTIEEREEIFKLRYEVFVEEIGYNLSHADNIKKIIREPLDNSAKIFAIFRNKQVISTLRINLSRNSDLGFYSQIYKMQTLAGTAHPQYTSISNYLIVKKEFRGSPIILDLARIFYEQLLLEGIKYDFLDCETYMLPFYSRLGYKNMGEITHPEFGKGYLMMLDICANRFLFKNENIVT